MSTALRNSSLGVHNFVREQVASALRPHGFAFDVARGMWTRSLGGEIEHVVSLPTDVAGDHGPVVVTANLGVFYRPLAARLAADNDRQRARNLSTFTRNLGQLSAKRAWREWIIREPSDAERVARRLATRIVSVGLPWLARFDSPAAVCEGFRTFGREDHRRIVVPLLERLMADPAARRGALLGTNAATDEGRVFSIRIDRDEAVEWHCDE